MSLTSVVSTSVVSTSVLTEGRALAYHWLLPSTADNIESHLNSLAHTLNNLTFQLHVLDHSISHPPICLTPQNASFEFLWTHLRSLPRPCPPLISGPSSFAHRPILILPVVTRQSVVDQLIQRPLPTSPFSSHWACLLPISLILHLPSWFHPQIHLLTYQPEESNLLYICTELGDLPDGERYRHSHRGLYLLGWLSEGTYIYSHSSTVF